MKLLLIALLLLAGCGSVSDLQQGADGSQTFIVCKASWNYTRDHGGTTFAGSAICKDSTTLSILYKRGGDFIPTAPGTYTKEQTGLPCDFTVDAVCGVVDSNTVF